MDKLNHGEFKPWIEANCDFSYRSARGYMKVARQNGSALPFSTLRQALGCNSDTLATKHKTMLALTAQPGQHRDRFPPGLLTGLQLLAEVITTDKDGKAYSEVASLEHAA